MIKKLQKQRLKSGCRFFVPGPLGSGAEVRLPAETAQHAVRALRLGIGDPIVLFDGSGGEYEARISHIDRHGTVAKTGAFAPCQTEAPIELVLGQGMSSGERMDFTVQKAVELGVTSILPLHTERCVLKLTAERATRKAAHWQKVAVAASEQCGRDRIADVGRPRPFSEWLVELPSQPDESELRLLLSADGETGFDALPQSVRRVVLLAGPEGGLSPAESAAARRRGFRSLRMGPRVLRTETAALAALAAIQLRWGDF
jgi:16S rRNA (uracil1498-N3)-methyltransferase